MDWKAEFTKIITQTSCPIVSSTDTEIVFTVKDYQCSLEFSTPQIKMAKVGSEKPMCVFPRIPPATIMVKNSISRLLVD
jgi:hypothetical protein